MNHKTIDITNLPPDAEKVMGKIYNKAFEENSTDVEFIKVLPPLPEAEKKVVDKIVKKIYSTPSADFSGLKGLLDET